MRRLAILLLPLALVALPTPAHAVDGLTFTVTSTADLPDAAPGDGACASSDTHCTLRAALDEATKTGSPVTITLPMGTFALTNGPLTVATDVTVTGAGLRTVLDAGSGDRVLSVSKGSLSLSDLALKGGEAPTGGGSAIEAEDSVVALHTVQIAGAHSDQGGGALEITGGSVLLDAVDIHDSDGRNGGALSAVNADVTITACTFRNNTATSHGGALFVSYPASLSVKGSTFEGNTAIGKGGAVYLEGRAAATKNLELSGTFTGNGARNEGGAVYVRTTSDGLKDGTVIVSGATFKDNSASVGGALGLNDGLMSVADSTFATNTARGGGGGAIAAAGEIAVTGSTFTSNTASESGGAISSVGIVRIVGSTFTTNNADVSGGALALRGWSMPSVDSSPFHGNTAVEGASAIWRGGAGLAQSKNTLDADQAVVVDQPRRQVEKVSLAKHPTNSKKWLYAGVAGGALAFLFSVHLTLVLRRRRQP